MRRLILLMIASLCFCTQSFGQSGSYDIRPQSKRLLSNEILSNFSGVTQSGAYNFDSEGVPGNRYTEWHGETGDIFYREGEFTAEGRWAVSRDLLCYDYKGEGITGGCFRIYKLGSCFYFYSARLVEKDDEITRDYWTARSVPKGERASCEDLFT